MPTSSASCLFTALTLLVLLHIGACYQCYLCSGMSSLTDNRKHIPVVTLSQSCVDLEDTYNVQTIECPGDCVKSVIYSNGAKHVTRGCVEPLQCLDRSGECYHCVGHLCNSSTKVVPSLITSSVLGLVLLNIMVQLFNK